jgi:hypothetical protein
MEPLSMKPEEQQIAIAEFCGYRFIPMGKGPTGFYYLNCTSEEDVDLAIKGKLNGATPSYNLPDYLNDLNAIHKATMLLTETQRKAMRYWLYQLTDQMSAHIADAPTRCEALLRTIGKWKE